MRRVHHYPEGATTTDPAITVRVDESKLNFVNVDAPMPDADSNLTDVTRVLATRVKEERRDALEKSEYLQSLSGRVHATTPAGSSGKGKEAGDKNLSNKNKSPAIVKSEADAEAVSAAAPPSSSTSARTVSPVKMDIANEAPRNGADEAKSKSKAKAKSKKIAKKVIDDMVDGEEDEFEDESEEGGSEENSEDEMSLADDDEIEKKDRAKVEESEEEGEDDDKTQVSLTLSYDSMDSDTDVAPE